MEAVVSTQSTGSDNMKKLADEGARVAETTPVILPEEIDCTEYLGGGQFGKVYKGKCRGMDVAIKFLEKFDQRKLREFLDEVQILSKVLNPHVVLLLGACTQGPVNEWCMVTELCSRGDLEHLLYDPELKLSDSRKYSFALDICLGLAWLNGRAIRVTHHDLKPANVLVTSDWRCKIGDFGLAWLSTKDQGFGTLSGGSPLYESPESLQVRLRISTAEVYSEKSDVWSYSMVLWEIFQQRLIYSDLEGKIPFSSAQEYYDFLVGGGKPPTEGLPPALLPLFRNCWHFVSTERPTFQEILIHLRHARVNHFISPKLFEGANKLWSEHFSEEYKISVENFVGIWDSVNPEEHVTTLKILFWGKEEKGHGRSITLSKFAKLLHWFGWNGLDNLLETMSELTKLDYFYGLLDSKLISQYITTPGQFLVRLNEGRSRGMG
eukprot:TRINITY_DN299_c0_g5_i1.p1 TRINITY_DN299_c0_g5~~TRINITY_DN299_c0_g5_i1.p1  ORF type:complete len:435 (+),score=92.33 TRINITY_DN299_c0_g5_i1:132-1436(+)